MPEKDDNYPLNLSAGDYTLRIAKAAASFTPIAGGAIDEVLSWITPSLMKKQAEWCDTLAERVRRLEKEGLNTENLQNDAEFASAIVQTMRIVLTTDQKIKLQALRNAVLNIAANNAPNADQRQILLNYVDQLTAAHLKVLKFLSGPIEWVDRHQLELPLYDTPQLYQVLTFVVPELDADTDLFKLITTDLFTRGLLTMSPGGAFRIGVRPKRAAIYGPRDALDPYQHMTSPLGDELLRFISSPLASDGELFANEAAVTEAV